MIILENETLRVCISTGRGARVEKFYDKRTGKNWVWTPEGYDQFKGTSFVDLEAGFDDNWAGGWEEVFPNDAPVTVEGYRLVDHGEVWRRSWVMDERSKDQHKVSFSINCETYPLMLKKTFIVDDQRPELMIEYEIVSNATKKLPFIFKFHPALAIEPEDIFKMPNSFMEPVALGFSRMLGTEEKSLFPMGKNSLGQMISINRALPRDNHTREFVRLSELESGTCSLINRRTESELRFNFSNEALPYVWMFQSYGGFMNHYVAMLEPTNAGHYDLSEARKTGKCGMINPGERLNFTIRLGVHS